MKLVVGEEASADLEEIFAWIKKDRPAAAMSVCERILTAMELLARFPRIGHAGRVPGTAEWVVSGLPYIIVYEIDGERDQLIVTGVFHGARDNRRR